jgi:hypothetical protein
MQTKQQKERRQEHKNRGMCSSHPQVLAAFGKTACQKCLDRLAVHRKESLRKGICPGHPENSVILGKTYCQHCADRLAIRRLPKNAQTDAQKRADETREARINGTYKCPVFNKTEGELDKLFPRQSNRSIWAFDHIGDLFRDIISYRANSAIGILSSTQLLQGVDYVKKYEI